MTSADPEITVVIPTRDRWELLQTTLTCALGQVDVAHEVVVVDDGSADVTSARLRCHPDPRLRVIRHASSMGVARARNAGIAGARGEWLAFLDDDDLWAPNKLAAQLAAARSAGAVFAYSGAMTVRADGQILQTERPPAPLGLIDALMLGNAIPAGASNVIARTDVVRDIGGFDPGLDHFADWDLWIRLARSGPAAIVDAPLVAYRQHQGSMLIHNWRPVADEFARVVRKHDDRDDPQLNAVRQAGLAAWQAWGHRRAGRRLRAARLYLVSGVRYRSRGNLARAVVSLLGERAMLVAGRIRRGHLRAPRVMAPAWLTRAF